MVNCFPEKNGSSIKVTKSFQPVEGLKQVFQKPNALSEQLQ